MLRSTSERQRHVDLSYLKEILKATQVSSCLKVCPDKNQINYKYNRDVREQVEIIRYREKEKNIERKLEQFKLMCLWLLWGAKNSDFVWNKGLINCQQNSCFTSWKYYRHLEKGEVTVPASEEAFDLSPLCWSKVRRLPEARRTSHTFTLLSALGGKMEVHDFTLHSW